MAAHNKNITKTNKNLAKKRVANFICTAVFLVLSSVSVALPTTGSSPKKIQRMGSMDNGMALLYAHDGWNVDVEKNRCSTVTPGPIAFDARTDEGKALRSMALAAFMRGKSVQVWVYNDLRVQVAVKAPQIHRIDIL